MKKLIFLVITTIVLCGSIMYGQVQSPRIIPGDLEVGGELRVTGDITVEGKLVDSVDVADGTFAIYISKTGSDETGDGSSGAPFATFQKASTILPDALREGTAPLNQIVYYLGAGTWTVSEMDKYLGHIPSLIYGDPVTAEGTSFTINRVTDTTNVYIITTAAADHAYSGYFFASSGSTNPVGRILDHYGDTLIAVFNTTGTTGVKDILNDPPTILDFDVRNPLNFGDIFASRVTVTSSLSTIDFKEQDRITFGNTVFETDGAIWFEGCSDLSVSNCVFRLQEQVYIVGTTRSSLTGNVYINESGSPRSFHGLNAYGTTTDNLVISGAWLDFDHAIKLNPRKYTIEDAYVRNSNYGIFIDQYHQVGLDLLIEELILDSVLTSGVQWAGSDYIPYQISLDSYSILDDPPTNFSNIDTAVYNLNTDSYFVINRPDNFITKKFSGRVDQVTPSGTINMDDYLMDDGEHHFNLTHGDYTVNPSSTWHNRIHSTVDTVLLASANKMFSWKNGELILSGEGQTDYAGLIRFHNDNISILDEYGSTRDGSGSATTGWYRDMFLGPEDNDTISFSSGVIGMQLAIRSHTSTSFSNHRVDAPYFNGMQIHVAVDDEVAVDSVALLHLEPDDNGIDPDSISKYYGILHRPQTGQLSGADETYFLYSEYGDNYLNGDLEVTGGIIQDQLTGSLTDGAPTDAEIDTITGTTPSAVGAGWQVTILDSDGTGLLYRVESDGTNWVYWVGTVAL